MLGDHNKSKVSPPPLADNVAAIFQQVQIRFDSLAQDVAAIPTMTARLEGRQPPPPPSVTLPKGFLYGMPGFGFTAAGGSSSSAGSSTAAVAMTTAVGVTTAHHQHRISAVTISTVAPRQRRQRPSQRPLFPPATAYQQH